ncbi:MAG: S9 family peptidase [Acidobacteria bacterium]|nr:S9 family peptidase [Acidobacteriota bacterium]
MVLVLTLALNASLPLAQKTALTLDHIFVEGGATGPAPQEAKWSPNGAMFTYILRSADGSHGDLWALDPASGQSTILVDNAALSRLSPSIDRTVTTERERERLTRYSIAGYLWSPDSQAILFSRTGSLHLFDLARKEAHPFLPDWRDLKDPQFSPDGKWISFVKDHDIWIALAGGGTPRRLTRGGGRNLLNGDLDWVYPEEFGIRSGYQWSPDSRRIAFLQLDQTRVGEAPIVDYLEQPHAVVQMQKYPKAGENNPKARIGVATLTGNISWLDAGAEYIPRFQWADAKTVALQLLNRHQNELDLVLWEVGSAKPQPVLKEREVAWVNVRDVLHFLPDNGILWASERDGFRHLYLYDRRGALVQRLTRGDWEVTAVNAVDTAGGWIYFTATERAPIERHFYRIRLDGSGMERLSRQGGAHFSIVDPTHSYYVDIVSSLLAPAQYSLVTLSNLTSTVFFRSRTLDSFELIAPEITELKAADAATVRVMILRSPALESGARHPVLVHIYGGPHAPLINNAFGGERFLWHQWMAQRGYVVAYIDGRTSAVPGHKYETAVYKNFGFVELQDHRLAIEYLKSLPFVDPDRIGLWGWSGGGYTTCFNMFNAADLFRVGVAVAPLTDFRAYDTIWTERYMGLPQENPEGYLRSSATTHAARLAGKLLLIHGTSDDNVHLQNTLQMAQRLIEAGKTFDLFLYPGKTHALAGTATRRHLYTQIADYFDRHLRSERPQGRTLLPGARGTGPESSPKDSRDTRGN